MCLGQAGKDWKTDIPARVTYLREKKREREGVREGPLMDRGPQGEDAGTCRSLSLLTGFSV